MRTPLSRHEKLAATSRFLATGRSYRKLKFKAIISEQLSREIIPETFKARSKATYTCHSFIFADSLQ
nr:unnamed protein product [Callosobruchus chinensis]